MTVVTIQQRRATSTEWSTKNPILKAGEIGFEIDTGKVKCGNGITPWNELVYISGDVNAVQNTGQSTTQVMSQKAVTEALNTKANTNSLGTAATRDVGESSGNVMRVGAFGLGRQSALNVDVTNATPSGIYSFGENSTGLPPQVRPNGAVGLIFNWGLGHQWGLFGKVQNNKVFLRRYLSSQNNDDVVELHTTGNILASTGQSTEYPMTQKAVTDALGGKVDKEVGKGLIEPAPEDGKEYARKDGSWVEVVGGGGGGDVEEAPLDGKTYVRTNGAWGEIDYVAPVTKNFIGVDPIDNGQWVPTYLDFPDTTKIYQGSVEIAGQSGEFISYKASYISMYQVWMVEMTHVDSSLVPLVYISADGMVGVVAAPLSLSINSGLPAGLNEFSGYGVVDIRGFMGLPVSTSYNPFEIQLSISSGYADVLLETSLYPAGEAPLEIETVYQGLTDKLGDGLGLMPTDLYSLFQQFELFGYGFLKGAKYWEADKELGEISGDNAYKITVKSASDEPHSVTLPIWRDTY